MRSHKAAIQAAAVKLSERAEECFDRAEDQHASAERQHADADKLEALGTALEADAARLFGETELHEAPATRDPPAGAASALRILLVQPNPAA